MRTNITKEQAIQLAVSQPGNPQPKTITEFVALLNEADMLSGDGKEVKVTVEIEQDDSDALGGISLMVQATSKILGDVISGRYVLSLKGLARKRLSLAFYGNVINVVRGKSRTPQYLSRKEFGITIHRWVRNSRNSESR